MLIVVKKWQPSIFILVLILCSLSSQHPHNSHTNKYLVSTKSCKIPDIPTNIPGDHPNSLPVDCKLGEILESYITKEEEKYFLRVKKVVNNEKEWNLEYSCCYSYVDRNGSQELPDEGIRLGPCTPFESAELTQDTVSIWCIKKEDSFETFTTVYRNIHQIVRLEDKLKSKNTVEKMGDQKPISVLFIVIDGVSRLNFIRTMPKTKTFITENGFYEMRGYNKIADNTYPNFMAWLTGLDKKEIYSICKPDEIDGLMNCPMIWYQYRNLGYVTAYAEDWSSIATFNYFKKGFKNPPTDLYFKPYFDAVAHLEIKTVDTMPYCTGPEIQGQRVLNLATDFANVTKNIPSFGVFWTNTFSHNNRTTTGRMDGNVEEMFKTLKNDGVLDEKIVILLSDHGNRYGDLIGTGRGFLEERLPMHYLSLPDWFKTKYPQETQTLQENTKKLTSTYDLYVTLHHLLVLSGFNVTLKQSKACPGCKSLFEKLPDDRSCENAGIPEEWCSCVGSIHTEKPYPEEENSLKTFIEFKVLEIIREKEENPLIKDTLHVKDIQELLKSEPKMDVNNLVNSYYFLVRFSTLGNDTFQVVFSRSLEPVSNHKIVHIRQLY